MKALFRNLFLVSLFAVAISFLAIPEKTFAGVNELPNADTVGSGEIFMEVSQPGFSNALDADTGYIRLTYTDSTRTFVSEIYDACWSAASGIDSNSGAPANCANDNTGFQFCNSMPDGRMPTPAEKASVTCRNITSRDMAINGWSPVNLSSLGLAPPLDPTTRTYNIYLFISFNDSNVPSGRNNAMRIRSAGTDGPSKSGNPTWTWAGYVANFNTAGWSKPIALQNRVNRTAGQNNEFNIYFGVPCEVAAGTRVRLRWKDADHAGAGGVPADANVNFNLFRNGEPWPSLIVSDPGQIGGQDALREWEITVNPGDKFRWRWDSIQGNNGIQFFIPFDEFNYFRDCPTNEVTNITVDADCDRIYGRITEADGTQPHVVSISFGAALGQPGSFITGAPEIQTDASGNYSIPRSRFPPGPAFHSSNIPFWVYTLETGGSGSGNLNGSGPHTYPTCPTDREYVIGITSSVAVSSSFNSVTASFSIRNSGDGPSTLAGRLGLATTIRVFNRQTGVTYANYVHPSASMSPVYYPPSWGPPWSTTGWTGWAGESINNRAIPELGYGEEVCINVTVARTSGYTDTNTFTNPNPAVSESCSPPRVALPYLQIYSGDVIAGGKYGNPDGSCGGAPGPATAGSISTFSATRGGRQVGSFVEYGAFAKNEITVDAPLTIQNFTSNAPLAGSNAFTFANTPADGEFGYDHCIRDYYNAYSATATATPGANFDVDNGNIGVYRMTGNVNLNRPGAGPINGSRIVLLVDGDVNINSNISLTNPGGAYATSNMEDLPFLMVVARGRVNIGPGVTQLDGIYVAQENGAPDSGVIDTCATGSSDLFGVCRSQLRVNGSLIAKRIDWRRTAGDINTSAADGDTKASSSAAEIITVSPEIYFARPPVEPAGQAGRYGNLRSLPPTF